jgi:hypothetical protein
VLPPLQNAVEAARSLLIRHPMKRWHLFVGSSVLVAASLGTACGTSSENDYGGAGGSGDVSGAQTTKAAASGTNAATKASGATNNNTATNTNTNTNTATQATNTTGGGACGMMATYGECVACYCDANQAGCGAYFGFEDEACLCGAGADCESSCGTTYCAGGEFDGTCATCYDGLTGMEACFETAYNDCMADATCSAYLAGESAECDALPE